ncbi:MAG: hypothetical protein ACC656_03275 [Candidatus Heimdallarchaeota archaeon]
MTSDSIIIIVAALFAFVGAYLLTPLFAKYMLSKGKSGKDVHKIDTPEIPEAGGIGFMLIYLVTIMIGIYLAPTELAK